jgi:flagellar hook assembly protein FlgD
VRRTVATICTALALAASLTGGPAQAAQATTVTKSAQTGQVAHARQAAAACKVAPPSSWHGTLTDDYLAVDSRHYAVRPGGEVREVVRFELPLRSRVHLNVRGTDGKYIRGPVNLGVLPAGWNYWTWTGHANGGAKAPDGEYNINIFTNAVSDGHSYVTGASAYVHRRYLPGSVNLSHTTVYPRSTAVHDSINLGVRPPRSAKLTMRVRDRAGKVVFTRSSKESHTYQRVRWDGRDRSGRPLPAGTYYVTSSGVDDDCFSGSTMPRKVVVSAKKLVTHTRTLTMPAADPEPLQDIGCMDCGPDCGTITRSDRFATKGALSFRSGPTDCGPLNAWQATKASRYIPHDKNAPRGYGTVTVSVFGGPTTPGAADQGALTVDYGAVRDTFYGGWSQPRTTTVMTGPDVRDHTTTSATVPIGMVEGVAMAPGFGWRFTTQNGASYDVATVTLTYTYLTPQG